MKILRPTLFVSIIAMLFLAGCDSDKTGDLELNFKLKYDGNPLVMFDDYLYPSGEFDLFFTRFSFYMSDLEGVKSTRELISDIDFINLSASHQDLSSSQQGFSKIYKDIPEGTYTGLDFGIGVPSNLNAMSPTDFANDNPLSESGEYWLGWESYVFLKIEGKIDLDGDGEFETGMSLHIGSDATFRNVSLNKAFEIVDGEQTKVEIDIDLKNAFESNGVIYDLEQTPNIHALEQLDFATELIDNLVSGFPN